MSYKDIFTEIYENYGFGSSESRSGPGSTLNETKSLREKIKQVVIEKKIRTVVDIPCGDFNWMKEIVFSFEEYVGGDIVEKAIEENNNKYSNSKINFINFDLTSDKIPDCDLLIVRDVIGHLPLDDGIKIISNILKSNCKYLLSTTWAKKTDNYWSKCESFEVHRNNEGVEYGRFYPVNLMSPPFNFPNPEIYLEEDVRVDRYEYGNRKILGFWEINKIRDFMKENNETLKDDTPKKIHEYTKTTLVTGLWDLGRNNLSQGWSRTYDHYLTKFEQLLQIDENLIIFGDTELEKFVHEKTNKTNIQFILKDLSWFKKNEYYDLIQSIRTNPDWYNQVGWLAESTQAKLEMYNPLVMSKMFLLHDAKILDKFNSEYMFWIDAGLTNTVHPGYFTHDKVFDKLTKYTYKFSFICFPYEANTEIHGFDYSVMNSMVNGKIDKVARAGFFGGPKDSISDMNTIYYNLLVTTLRDGYMGTEESIFTLMCYLHSDLINYFEIESNGLIGTFFENLKNDRLEVKSEGSPKKLEVYKTVTNILNIDNVGLYVISFNSPKQFEVLIQSMLDYDKDFIHKPKKFLLDNSTDLSTTPRYIELCEQYGFEHIKKVNLGIVGGRVFVAEHFDETGLDFYYFFEDDMAFYPKKGEICRNGFPRYVDNLYQKSLEIISKENFDFLKLNFSEFYGDNSVQWSWYNVPKEFRQSHWPEKPNLPVQGLDPNAPKTEFKHIKTHKGVPYASGEVYLCNWPIVLTKQGNYKCYLETKWAHPHEQTLMSYSFQETVKGKINPGLLLMTPTEHNRFDHYDGKLRKES